MFHSGHDRSWDVNARSRAEGGADVVLASTSKIAVDETINVAPWPFAFGRRLAGAPRRDMR
jgi:hypothetical protein